MDNLHWAMLLADREHQPDAASVRSAASGAAPCVLQLETAQGVRSLVRGARLADGVASARLRAFGKGAPGAELGRFVAASNALVPGYFAPATAAAPGDDGEGAVGRFGLWLQPFASWGEQRGGRGYNDLDEKYRGASLGLAWDSGPLVFSLSGHYVGAELDASGYEAEADALGLTLGLGRQFRVNDSFAPWAELRLGWTAYELDQQRRDHGGDQVYSSPDVNVYSAGLLADNDFTFGSVTLTPHLALDYAHLDMDAYAERGGNYALRVDPKDYQSLRGTAGLAAAWQATEALALKGLAAWHLEMKDKRGELRTSAVTLPSLDLTTRGEDLDRSSGTLGAGFLWQPGRNVSVGMDYDFAFGERYSGHTVSGVLKVSF